MHKGVGLGSVVVVVAVVVVVVDSHNLSIYGQSAHSYSTFVAINSNLAHFLVGSDWKLHFAGFACAQLSPIHPILPVGCFEFSPTEP